MSDNTQGVELLKPSEAARVLGLSAQRVRQLADSGRIASHTTPYGRLLERADVERLRAERAAAGR